MTPREEAVARKLLDMASQRLGIDLGPWDSLSTDVKDRYLEDALHILALPEIVKMQEAQWQPIETAPKDGTPFLAYWLRRYTNGERYEAGQPFVVASYHGGRIFPSWIQENGDIPTHWMPLPSAPALQPLKKEAE